LKTKGNILIVGFNKQLSANLKAILEAKQFTVDYAVNAEKGLLCCQTNSFDIAFVDIKLPNFSGREIVNKIKKNSPSTDCIYFTDYSSPLSSIETKQQKHVNFSETKPLELDKFLSIIEQIVERKNAEKKIKRIEKIKDSIFKLTETTDSTQNLKELASSIHRIIGELVLANTYHIALFENSTTLHSVPYYFENNFHNLQEQSKNESTGTPLIDWVGVPVKVNNRIIAKLVVQGYATSDQFKEGNKPIISFVSKQLVKTIGHNELKIKLKNEIKEKNLLIKEIHHHFCNNQQLINSSTKNQTEDNKNVVSINNFDEIRNRVYPIALVQRELYKSKNQASINFKAIIQKIVNGLYMTYFHEMPGLNLKLNIKNSVLDIDRAILCGLILNELISNSLKHAFPSTWEKKKMVSVKFRPSNNNHVELIVSDNGVGLPKDLDFRNTKSIGLNLVNIFENQLNGKITLDRQSGTGFCISFEKSY
jgi:two-component sensor histidine kinase/CheY-like chemotaxis protein